MHDHLGKIRFLSALIALGIAFTSSGAVAAGDAAKGKKVYKKCAICHSVEPGKNKIGPSLSAIVGAKAAKVKGFRYSSAMKKSGITWNDASLDKFLKSPRKMIKGTRMTFAGLRSAKDRANVIAYLKTLK